MLLTIMALTSQLTSGCGARMNVEGRLLGPAAFFHSPPRSTRCDLNEPQPNNKRWLVRYLTSSVDELVPYHQQRLPKQRNVETRMDGCYVWVACVCIAHRIERCRFPPVDLVRPPLGRPQLVVTPEGLDHEGPPLPLYEVNVPNVAVSDQLRLPREHLLHVKQHGTVIGSGRQLILSPTKTGPFTVPTSTGWSVATPHLPCIYMTDARTWACKAVTILYLF